ncbi:hypothetical protein NW762_007550 [Fusarium torreyae]|uniref:Uncharacterized protein n=1 Tax=Fusarium torreyae TaxID=1237075 RepID=A0A9W8RZS9_9HYPO|nr:hypothetical protein NW762_007550 [Fusarium torreyae]
MPGWKSRSVHDILSFCPEKPGTRQALKDIVAPSNLPQQPYSYPNLRWVLQSKIPALMTRSQPRNVRIDT